MTSIAVLLAMTAALWRQAWATSFKLESKGMLVQGNSPNFTRIEHNRPITNVKSIVASFEPGQLQDNATSNPDIS